MSNRDNHPVLVEVSDTDSTSEPSVPTQIGETFAENADTEWTEPLESHLEAETALTRNGPENNGRGLMCRGFLSAALILLALWPTGWFRSSSAPPDVAAHESELSTAHASLLPAAHVKPTQPKFNTKPIEQLRVGGDWVLADNPELADDPHRLHSGPDGLTTEYGRFNPATWRVAHLRMTNPEGYPLDIWLARPLDWLSGHGITTLGQRIWLNLEHTEGTAYVLSINQCPQPPPRTDTRQRLITGRFEQTTRGLVRLTIADLNDPLEATPGHPFWSETKTAFVRADELHPGDRVRLADGETALVQSVASTSRTARIYNIEVDAEHVYYVSRRGVLVHNKNCSDTATPDTDRRPSGRQDKPDVVYRALAPGENPQMGLRARAPGVPTKVESHVMGKRESNLISTTRDESKARVKFNSGNGVVAIDLGKVDGNVIDASRGYGRGRVYSRTLSDQEVLIEDLGDLDVPIPPEAITVLE